MATDPRHDAIQLAQQMARDYTRQGRHEMAQLTMDKAKNLESFYRSYTMIPNDVIMTNYPTFENWKVESMESLQKRQELDQQRNMKLFLHHAKLFCERFPNWSVTPDPTNPFKSVLLTHKNNKYRIESAYPNNEVKLWGIQNESIRRSQEFARDYGIPPSVFNNPYTESAVLIPIPTFFGWSIGMNDVPEYIKE